MELLAFNLQHSYVPNHKRIKITQNEKKGDATKVLVLQHDMSADKTNKT